MYLLYVTIEVDCEKAWEGFITDDNSPIFGEAREFDTLEAAEAEVASIFSITDISEIEQFDAWLEPEYSPEDVVITEIAILEATVVRRIPRD